MTCASSYGFDACKLQPGGKGPQVTGDGGQDGAAAHFPTLGWMPGAGWGQSGGSVSLCFSWFVSVFCFCVQIFVCARLCVPLFICFYFFISLSVFVLLVCLVDLVLTLLPFSGVFQASLGLSGSPKTRAAADL